MTKMNLIIALVCALIASIVCDADMDKFIEMKQQARKVCQEKTKVSTELIESVAAGNFPEGNKDLKCYIACGMEQLKSMKDGKFDKSTTLEMIDTMMPESLREAAKKALNACDGKFDGITDSCELAWEMAKCWKHEKNIL